MHTADKHSLGDIQLYSVAVSDKTDLGNDAFVLYFNRFFDFYPGQVVAISMRRDEPPRLYSICSGPEENEIAILFKVTTNGFLTPRLADLQKGEKLFVSKPFGTFYGTKESAYWVATGTGIAPFVSMQKAGLANGKILIHGGRDILSFYFHEIFENTLDLKYIPCSSRLKEKRFYRGRLTEFLKSEKIDVEKYFFVCGSSEMVVQVRDILIDRGVPYEKIIAEIYF